MTIINDKYSEIRKCLSNAIVNTLNDASVELLEMAQHEAYRFDHAYCGSHHLIPALLRQQPDNLHKIFTSRQLDVRRLRASIECLSLCPTLQTAQRYVPFTRCVERSLSPASRVEGKHLVRPVDIIYSILSDHESWACVMLHTCRVETSQLLEGIGQLRQLPLQGRATNTTALS